MITVGKIIDILSAIGNFFKSVVDFIVSLFEDLVYVIKLLGQTVAKLPDYLGFLPSVAIAVFVSAIAVVIVFRVIGRDT